MPALQFTPDGQVFPHPPQCCSLVCMLTQTFPHFVVPDGQHEPLLQSWPAGQAWPQAPQLFASLLRLTQVSPHLVSPGPHMSWVHAPPLHWLPAAQVLPHPPQFLGSVAWSMHDAPHLTCPATGQPPGRVHVPLLHIRPDTPQLLPQAPQFESSDLVSTQRPLHAVWPLAQARTHWPALQDAPLLQLMPQPPQLFASVLVLAQDFCWMPQALSPLGQDLQIPLSHVWPGMQAFPQAPQLSVLFVVLVHLPPQTEMPGWQVRHAPLLHIWLGPHAGVQACPNAVE